MARWRVINMLHLLQLPLTVSSSLMHFVYYYRMSLLKKCRRQFEWVAPPECCFQCSLCGYLPLQATPLAPAGILARPPTPAGRWGTLKCAVRCASPARWGTLCTARRRGSASPTEPGRANSRSANVRAKLVLCVWKQQRSHADK